MHKVSREDTRQIEIQEERRYKEEEDTRQNKDTWLAQPERRGCNTQKVIHGR